MKSGKRYSLVSLEKLRRKFARFIHTAYPGARCVRDTKKGVYDYFVLDSDVEEGFCKDLEASDEVKVYTKLPRGFYIDTPVGKYNPDWATDCTPTPL